MTTMRKGLGRSPMASPALRWRAWRRVRPTRRRRSTSRRPSSRPTVSINTMWVIVAARAGDVHAGRLRVPRDRLLAGEERRRRRREDPRQLLDRLDRLLGGRLRARLRRRRERSSGTDGLLLRRRVDSRRRRRRSSQLLEIAPISPATLLFFQFVFCAVSLAIVWGTTLERIKFAAYVIYAVVFAPSSTRCRPLGLRRRLAADGRRQHRHAGLRRLDGGPPDRRHRRARGAAAARPADRQVRRATASRGRSRATRCRWSASAC